MKSRQLSLKECYSILNLEKGATLEDVKRAYRRRAFELHPDLHPGNAEAGRQFQRLNEAYVALSQILQTEAAKDEATRAERAERNERCRGASTARGQSAADAEASAEKSQQERDASAQESANAKAGAQTDSQAGAQSSTGSHANAASSATSATGPSGDADTADNESSADKSSDEERRKRAASAAYGREEVLRDLLNDPFARRVFEDIYSEVNRQTQDTTPPPPPPRAEPPPPPTPKAPPKPRNVQMEWGSHKLNLDFSKGLKGMVKGWLRHQIDDEQTIKMPASSLIPGARIRLQIRRGLSEELSTIEITLPKDFVVGKPVRLRGLGRKVGQWQGDLYLTLESR